ncbi:MAG: hypothetical protein AAB267_09315, partial [Candidatus Desantisbacteria bacterium]
MKKIGFLSIILVLGLASNGFSEDVTNRQILEKLNSLEEGQKSLQKQIDDVRSLLYVILAGMFALVGFIIWDRRTALAPAVKKVEALEKKEEALERVL